MTLETPLLEHRHLEEAAGRDLTKAAIEEIITRGDYAAWRGLVRAIRADGTGRVARRAREVAAATARSDPKAKAFVTLLKDITKQGMRKPSSRG